MSTSIDVATLSCTGDGRAPMQNDFIFAVATDLNLMGQWRNGGIARKTIVREFGATILTMLWIASILESGTSIDRAIAMHLRQSAWSILFGFAIR